MFRIEYSRNWECFDRSYVNRLNRPLLSSKNPHFQNEAKGTTFLVKMSFICMRMKNHFHIKGWALNSFWYRGPVELGTLRFLFLSHLLYEICVKIFIMNRYISESYTTTTNHYWMTIYRARAAGVSTITSITSITSA